MTTSPRKPRMLYSLLVRCGAQPSTSTLRARRLTTSLPHPASLVLFRDRPAGAHIVEEVQGLGDAALGTGGHHVERHSFQHRQPAPRDQPGAELGAFDRALTRVAACDYQGRRLDHRKWRRQIEI